MIRSQILRRDCWATPIKCFHSLHMNWSYYIFNQTWKHLNLRNILHLCNRKNRPNWSMSQYSINRIDNMNERDYFSSIGSYKCRSIPSLYWSRLSSIISNICICMYIYYMVWYSSTTYIKSPQAVIRRQAYHSYIWVCRAELKYICTNTE